MFSAFLQQHSLLSLLREDCRMLYPPAADRAAWEAVSTEHRQEIFALSEEFGRIPWPMRPATAFLAFVRDGSRRADEDPYFLRRRKLCAAALRCCMDPEASLDPVIDGIWCICEETAWVISAHNVNPIPGAPAAADAPLPDPDNPCIDLFSAQTGMILSLVLQLLGDALDRVTPALRARVRREIDRRILLPFMTRDDFWWMGFIRKDLNNWTPWILSNVLVCAIASPMDLPSLAALTERALSMLDRYLDVLPADGGCDEGAGYWNMAGGALMDCLELVEKITGHRAVFWQDPKIRNILSFPLRAEIGGGWFVNFADCDARPALSGERLQLAGEKTGDPALTAMGCRCRGTLRDQLSDVPHFTRMLSLLFHPAPEAVPAAPAPGDVWLPDLQLRLVRRDAWVLCCKGGHNGENHNHNDVGSFMLYLDGEPRAVDAGNMVYTAKTFSADRYSLWNVRSAYHNLPLIGGMEQKDGARYAARDVVCTPDGLSLDMAGAWEPSAGLSFARRDLVLDAQGLRLRDRIALSHPEPVTWVFMLREKPEFAAPGVLRTPSMTLRFPESLSFALEEIPVEDPRMQRNFPGSLWRVLLTAEAAAVHEAAFRFSRGAE